MVYWVTIFRYKWRIELSRTEKHWEGWFGGLSSAFLHTRSPRLLLLASVDGLDRELTVGQMQGKFQMQVLTRCGHAVHEDTPGEVARVVASFILRHRLTTATENGELMNLVSAPVPSTQPRNAHCWAKASPKDSYDDRSCTIPQP
ncbi:Protein phosphatase methylesterase 1 [Papilio machaon]|uniref:protein phosphatase methylesterase-1 n=1 Tax=Papilio machaon TaxID=76193 RepID=A0A0N1I719_PAPMA|nr:Protein phosphatase methylesterase 1 [Papilio machaon]